MKRYILTLSFILGFIVSGYGQSNQVTFIPGLNENINIWDTMANQLDTEFNFTRYNVSYNTNDAISSSASSVFIPNGTVAVSHSLGGVLAREYLRQRSPNNIKALIAVGAPNLGAPVARSVQNGEVADVISGWITDLAAGPATSLGSLLGRQFARQVIGNLGYIQDASGQKVYAQLQAMFGNSDAVDDLKPNSTFLNTLNASPNNTLPSARYAIFGNEKGPEYVRIGESFVNGQNQPMESGLFVRYHRAASAFYFVATSYYSYLSGFYFYKYAFADTSDPFYFSYYDRAVFFAQIARQWFRGFASLVYYQQRDWDQRVIGVNYYSGSICGNADICKDANDGLLPATTQAPSFFETFGDNIDRRLPAEGANHLEETVHPSVKQRLREVFLDQGIPEAEGGDGGGGPIDPPPLPDPCPPDENGNIPIQC